MKPTEDHNQRIAKLTFASVYPNYASKIVKKIESFKNYTK